MTTQTFPDLVNGFLRFSESKASWPVYKRIYDRDLQQWSQHPTFGEIEDWHRAKARTPHHSNKALSFVKAMYTWAIRRGYYSGHNPATGVKAHPTFSRERVMTSQEIALLLSCLDCLPKKISVLLQLLLTTGCRLTEGRSMRWEDVDWQTGVWRQPKTKNGRPHVTYLPTQTRAALMTLKGPGPFVFRGAYDHCWSRPGVEKVWWEMRGSLGLQDVRLHDFRRTLSTHLYRATKDDYLVKRCINHTNKNITAIYVRISEEEVAKALQAQADRFWALPVAVVPPAVVERSYTSIDAPLEDWKEPAHDPDSSTPPPVLSAREQEVLIGLAQGHSLKAIAESQGVSAKTTDTYRSRLREKLQLRTTNELIRFAIEHENDVTMPMPTQPTPMPALAPPVVGSTSSSPVPIVSSSRSLEAEAWLW